MRFLFAFLVVMAGCVATLPGDNGLTADLAAETARMVVQMRREIAPTPPAPPRPTPGKCPACLGTGRMSTDGRIVIPCPTCQGLASKANESRSAALTGSARHDAA